jgi:predicted ester cyclase
MTTPEVNKSTVLRFNKEVIEQGNLETFNELMDKDFVNNTAPSASNGPESMWHTFNNILRPAFSDLKVEIYDQIAEGDKVTTRKAIMGTHTGELLGISSTNKKIRIDVIDIIRLRNGKYLEHWGINNFQSIITELKNMV